MDREQFINAVDERFRALRTEPTYPLARIAKSLSAIPPGEPVAGPVYNGRTAWLLINHREPLDELHVGVVAVTLRRAHDEWLADVVGRAVRDADGAAIGYGGADSVRVVADTQTPDIALAWQSSERVAPFPMLSDAS